MTEVVTIAFNGPGSASFGYSAENTLVVPEPSSLTLAVLGVLGLVGNGGRRAAQDPGRLSPAVNLHPRWRLPARLLPVVGGERFDTNSE
jgi:PEP-CTERM motif